MRAHGRDFGHRASTDQRRRIRLAGSITMAMLLLMGVFAGGARASMVTQPSVTVTPPSAAAGAKTVYTVGFATSATGGLSQTAGSQITLTFPPNTDLTGLVGSSVKVPAINNTSIGNCFRSAPTVVTCGLFTGNTIAPNTTVSVEIDGVINPTTTSTLFVATTQDTTPSQSGRFGILAAQQLSVPSVTLTPPSAAAGAKTIYTVGFTTSSTGGLSQTAGSQIMLTFPPNTDLTGLVGSSVKVPAISNTSIGNCFRSLPTVVTCGLFTGNTIAANATVSVEVDGVINAPSTGSGNTLTVDTTSDTANSNTFSIAVAQQLSAPSITDTPPSAAAAAKTIYTVGFTTSSTGGLSQTAGSQVMLTFPPNTDLTGLVGSSVKVPAISNTSIGNCFRSLPTVVTCGLFTGNTIAPNTTVSVEVDGVINAPSTGSNTLTVDTTSDTQNTNAFSIVPGQLISQQTVVASNPAAGATGVTYTVGFTTSSTGGLSQTAGSQIKLTFPPSTDLTHLTGSSVADTSVSNGSIGNCFRSAPTVVTCGLFTGNTVGPGHTVRVVVLGVTNPSPFSNALVVSTTSDTGLAGGGGPPPPPSAPTIPAVAAPAPKSATVATVSGTVNPQNQLTTVVFQYGLDPSLRGPGASTALYDQSTPPQQVGSDSIDHPVSANLTNLLPNALYHVRLVATNAAGTTTGPDQTFRTQAPPKLPPPVLGKTQNAQPVSGRTFILVNGKFVPLTGATKIPSGTTIDALHGTLNLTSATGKGKKTQTGTFGGAVFNVVQARAGALKGLTTLSLVNNAFKGAPSPASCTTHGTKQASAAALSKKVLQLLHAKDNHGKFRTKGRYAAATTRGTVWSIADRCDGTLTHVNQGTVIVNDLVKHKNITVHAGGSYLAKAHK